MATKVTAKEMVVDTLAKFHGVDPATITDDSLVYGACADAHERLRLNLALMQANSKRGRMQTIGPVSIATFRVKDLARDFGDHY